MSLSKTNRLSILLSVLYLGLGIIFSLVLLISIIQYYSFNQSYFKKQFKKNHISSATGLSESDLDKVIQQMTGYLSGSKTSFNLTLEISGKEVLVFNERELAHMLDVKVIYILLDKIKNFGILLLGIFFIPYSIYVYFACRKHRNAKNVYLRRHYWMNLGKTMIFNGIFTVFFIAALGYMLLTDFSKYFVIFHEVFFDNDLWLLDPQTDRLIQMLPEVFFYDISARMVSSYALISLVLSLIGAFFFFLLRKDDHSI